MWKDWNFWLSVITAAVATTALILTVLQIKISNKQHLFDRRLKNYIVVRGLIQLYEDNNHLFNRANEPIAEIDLEFGWMMNNSYFEFDGITEIINDPLKLTYRKEFLKKLEDLKNISIEAEFLYIGKLSNSLSRFVNQYQKLLLAMYQYLILYIEMHKASEQFGWSFEEACKAMKETEQRKKLFMAISNLKQAYENLQKVNFEKKIEKQVRLR